MLSIAKLLFHNSSGNLIRCPGSTNVASFVSIFHCGRTRSARKNRLSVLRLLNVTCVCYQRRDSVGLYDELRVVFYREVNCEVYAQQQRLFRAALTYALKL